MGECDATAALCPKTRRALRRRRRRDFELRTVAGVVKLHAWYGYSSALKKSIYPVRESWKMKPYQCISPELGSRLTYTSTETGSYQTAAKMATTWGSPVSDGCIHQLVKELGEMAKEMKLPPVEPAANEPPFSLVIMLDGWMARERGPDWGTPPSQKQLERIVWREIKSAVIYRLGQRGENASGRGMLIEKFAVATPP